MKTNLGKTLWIGILVLFGLSLTVLAQNTRGSLGGTVLDSNKAAVAGAAVKAKNQATGAEVQTTTDSQGSYTFPSLDVGVYSVTVEAKGFKRTDVKGVTVDVSTPARIDVPLTIGDIKEELIITSSEQEIINSTSPTLTNVVDPRQIKELPLLNRNPLDLARLQANISIRGTDTRNATVEGLRGSATNITQDGINAMDNLVKTSSFFAITAPQVESTAEFSITVGQNGADAGRGLAQVSVVTQGGSNAVHGSAFWFHRNSALNANSFFNNASGTPITKDIQNRIGFSVGGPVVIPGLYNGKDKSFWFMSYEAFREPLAVTNNRTVLTADARNGIYKYLGFDNTVQTVNLLNLPGIAHPGINATTAAILAKTPLPNTTANSCGNADGFNVGCFSFNTAGVNNQDRFSWRGDQVLKQSGSNTHKLEFVWSRGLFATSPDTLNGNQSAFPGGISASQNSTRTLISTAIISTFGSTMTNEARYGLNRAPVGFLRDAPPDTPFFTTFSGSETSPQLTFLSQGRDTTVYEFLDNFSWVKGQHSFKFGMDLQSITFQNFNDGGIFPTVVLGNNAGSNPNLISLANGGATGANNPQFPNLPNGNTGVTDATIGANIFNDITGWLNSSSQTFNAISKTSGFVPGATFSQPIRQRDLSIYAADTWRFRNNLTLTPGLRWEFLGVPVVPNGLVVLPPGGYAGIFGISGVNANGIGNLFNPNALPGTSKNLQAAAITYDFAGPGTKRTSFYNNDWKDFAPSLGIAYSPNFKNTWLKRIFGDAGSTAFRGGYSISYLRDGLTVASNLLGDNSGVATTSGITNPTGVLGPNGLTVPTPVFGLPTTDFAAAALNPGRNQVFDTIPNLTTPYVEQWSFGIQREIGRSMALEIRYVGNHALKLYRLQNINETNIFENGFLADFVGAQNNLAICQANATACKQAQTNANLATTSANNFANWGLPGQVALPQMEKIFDNSGLLRNSTSGFASSGFISNLGLNNVGTMAGTLATSSTYAGGRGAIAANFFRANPNALGGAFVYNNGSMSNYNSLVIELRKRFSQGMQFQFDYTFSHNLTNAAGNGGQSENDNLQTIRNPLLDYRNSSVDQTHRFIGNMIYELPFGPGKRWNFGNGNLGDKALNKVIEGWQINSIINWQSGVPLSISSGRTTFNGNSELGVLLNGTTLSQLQSAFGVFRTPNGVFGINPDLLNFTCTLNNAPVACGTPGSSLATARLKDGLVGAPAPGQHGQLNLNSNFRAPRFFQTDISVLKSTKVTEKIKTEFRAEMFNAFNNVNFGNAGGLTFDNSKFGLITGQNSGAAPRIIQLALRIVF